MTGKYTEEEISKMSDLEIQEKLKVCPICWSKDHLCGECESQSESWRDEQY